MIKTVWSEDTMTDGAPIQGKKQHETVKWGVLSLSVLILITVFLIRFADTPKQTWGVNDRPVCAPQRVASALSPQTPAPITSDAEIAPETDSHEYTERLPNGGKVLFRVPVETSKPSRPAILPASSDRIPTESHAGVIGETGTWQVAETTHIDGWVKKVRKGTIFKTESTNLYEVTEPIFISGMELRPKVTVLTDGQKYKLLIEGLEENPICDKVAKRSIPIYPGSRVITGQILAGSDGRTFAGLNHGNIYRLDNGQVWEQTEFYIHHYTSVMPNVVIWNDGVTDMLKVEGIDKAVAVRRLN